MRSMEKKPTPRDLCVVLRLKDGRVDPVCMYRNVQYCIRKADLVSQPQGISAADYFRIVFPTSTCCTHTYILD